MKKQILKSLKVAGNITFLIFYIIGFPIIICILIKYKGIIYISLSVVYLYFLIFLLNFIDNYYEKKNKTKNHEIENN